MFRSAYSIFPAAAILLAGCATASLNQINDRLDSLESSIERDIRERIAGWWEYRSKNETSDPLTGRRIIAWREIAIHQLNDPVLRPQLRRQLEIYLSRIQPNDLEKNGLDRLVHESTGDPKAWLDTLDTWLDNDGEEPRGFDLAVYGLAARSFGRGSISIVVDANKEHLSVHGAAGSFVDKPADEEAPTFSPIFGDVEFDGQISRLPLVDGMMGLRKSFSLKNTDRIAPFPLVLIIEPGRHGTPYDWEGLVCAKGQTLTRIYAFRPDRYYASDRTASENAPTSIEPFCASGGDTTPHVTADCRRGTDQFGRPKVLRVECPDFRPSQRLVSRSHHPFTITNGSDRVVKVRVKAWIHDNYRPQSEDQEDETYELQPGIQISGELATWMRSSYPRGSGLVTVTAGTCIEELVQAGTGHTYRQLCYSIPGAGCYIDTH